MSDYFLVSTSYEVYHHFLVEEALLAKYCEYTVRYVGKYMMMYCMCINQSEE